MSPSLTLSSLIASPTMTSNLTLFESLALTLAELHDDMYGQG